MAPKVCVPADFGRHHIGAPSHGNLTFNLGEGVKIRANSIILSLNSPVIDELTTNLHQTSLEADDFSREAVDCFVESTYTGEIEAVNLGNFRDVNKMSRVFQVSWLVAKCEEYFVSYLDKLDSESSYSDILFVVEEAVFLMSAIKSRDFLEIVVMKIASISVTKRDCFIKEYLLDFGQASLPKIDACIAVVQSDVHVLVELLIQHLKKSGKRCLDSASRHLLKSIDMASCFDKKPKVHSEIFSVLENLTEITRDDLQLFVFLYKKNSSKECPSGSKAGHIEQMQPIIKPDRFSKLTDIWPLMHINVVFNRIASREDIDDLYSLIDILWYGLYYRGNKYNRELLRGIADLAEHRRWCPIGRKYANALVSTCESSAFLKQIRLDHNIVSKESDGTFVTIFTLVQQEFIREVFCKNNAFKFQISIPGYLNTEFVLSTTAVKEDKSGGFDMRWGFSYTPYGCNLTALPKLHFALVVLKDDDSWDRLLPMTYCGKPTQNEHARTDWFWGYIKFMSEPVEYFDYQVAEQHHGRIVYRGHRIRLVAFLVQ